MSKEAMKLALEALQEVYWSSRSAKHDEAITSLNQALANEALDRMAENARELGLDYELQDKDPDLIEQPAQQEKDWGAVGEAHIAAIKKSSKATVEDAVVRAVHKVMAEFKAKSDERLMGQPAQQEPEFFTHCVDQPYDWSEWVCPDPKGYLMKCCDCGLVHEAEFGVVRYKSETEREDCDMVDDPNLQAVFRMRRSEQWSPADMAHRAGGLTMEQPAQQEPVALVEKFSLLLWDYQELERAFEKATGGKWVRKSNTPQRTWVGLTDEEIEQGCKESWVTEQAWQSAVWWAEARLKEKNT